VPEVNSLRMHLIEELTDLLDAEEQLTKALPKMATMATSASLKTAFQRHLTETRGQITRLNEALRRLGEKPRRKTCEGMKGLLSEGRDVMNKTPQGPLRDAVMIAAAQKVEHYEMASYGTARTYAEVLGEPGVARLLEQTLRQEKAADAKLTTIAEASVNEDAAHEWQSQVSDAGILERSALWLGRAVGSARRQWAGGARSAAGSKGVVHERKSVRPSRGSVPLSRSRHTGARRSSRTSARRRSR
jgi:ferritin-like metal-binding protein YciE